MSDDEHNDTPENPEDNSDQGDDTAPEPDAEAKPKRFESKKGEDQEPLSDDPEINAIAELGYDEIERIVDNPDDPRHEKAKEYLRLYWQSPSGGFTPLIDAINKQYADLWKNVIGQSMPRFEVPTFDFSKYAPKIEIPDFTKRHMPGSTLPPAREPVSSGALPRPAEPTDAKRSGQESMTAGIVETNAKLTEMLEHLAAAPALMAMTNDHLGKMVKQSEENAAEQKALLQQQIDEAKKAADDQVERAMDEHSRAVEAWWVAWIAIAVTGLVGVGQLAFSALPYLAR